MKRIALVLSLLILAAAFLCGGRSALSAEGQPGGVTSDTIGGEWTGLGSDGRLFILRVDEVSQNAVLAVSERAASQIETHLYDVGHVTALNGQFAAQDRVSGIKIAGHAECLPGSASGVAQVTLPVERERPTTFQVHLFRLKRDSWATHISQTYRTATFE